MKNSALFDTKPSFRSFTKNDDPIINTNKKVSKSADSKINVLIKKIVYSCFFKLKSKQIRCVTVLKSRRFAYATAAFVKAYPLS